jgi:cobalt-precorrin-5B (C1)-methyltransferase
MMKNENGALKKGFTTGSCAAAASKAAARILLYGEITPEVSISLPKGGRLVLEIEDVHVSSQRVSCGVRKESGDDPDVTNQMMIMATVEKDNHPGIRIRGGAGVGLVTKPGLSVPVGEPAINPIPLKMIQQEMQEICQNAGYQGGLTVTVSVPGGEEAAKRTFNPRLGIQGGISILGTTGIVEPMSEAAIQETIRLELVQKIKTSGTAVMACPGNYGESFIKSRLGVEYQPVLCSNYIGEFLDYCRIYGVEKLLLVGHSGKLVKLAAGIMNTHSRAADGRMEILAAYGALYGASQSLVAEILEASTTERANILLETVEGLKEQVYKKCVEKMIEYMNYRVGNQMEIGVLLFDNHQETIAKSGNAASLLKCFPFKSRG